MRHASSGQLGKGVAKTLRFGVFAAVVALATAACSSDDAGESTKATPAPEAATFEGFWENRSNQLAIEGDAYWLIEDGAVIDRGAFRAGVSLNFVSGSDSPACDDGMAGIWDVELADDEQSFLTTLVSADCPAALAIEGRFTRVDPFAIPDTTSQSASQDGNDLVDPTGIWRLGNMDIEFDDGTYTITRDSELLDRGTYETSPGGSQETPGGSEIILRSAEDSPECEPGAERVSTYEIWDKLTLQLHDDSCPTRLNAMLPWMDLTPTS